MTQARSSLERKFTLTKKIIISNKSFIENLHNVYSHLFPASKDWSIEMGRQPQIVWGTWKRKKYKTRGMSGWAQIKSIFNGDNVKRKLQTYTSQVTFTLNSWTHHLNKKWALKVKILHLGCTTWYLESSREQSRAHLDAAWLDFLAILVAWTLSLILVFEELRCASSWEPFEALPWGVWIFI